MRGSIVGSLAGDDSSRKPHAGSAISRLGTLAANVDKRGNGNEEKRARCWRCEGAPTTAPASCCWALLVETPGGRYPRRVGTVSEERGLAIPEREPHSWPAIARCFGVNGFVRNLACT